MTLPSAGGARLFGWTASQWAVAKRYHYESTKQAAAPSLDGCRAVRHLWLSRFPTDPLAGRIVMERELEMDWSWAFVLIENVVKEVSQWRCP